MDVNFERKFILKWETVFDQTFHLKQIWNSTLELPLSNTEKQFQWAIFTKHKLFLMNMSTGLCHFCKTNTETIKHLFYVCSLINRVIHKLKIK